jgi:hypothetical protein
MATMSTTLSPQQPRRSPPAPMNWDSSSQLALAELFPDVKAAADEALAELFPALRLRRRQPADRDGARR